jgi:hypothetical protein
VRQHEGRRASIRPTNLQVDNFLSACFLESGIFVKPLFGLTIEFHKI